MPVGWTWQRLGRWRCFPLELNGRRQRPQRQAGGVEANVGDASGLGCRRLALGVFGFTGDSTNSWGTGRDKSSNDGVGAYIRASSALGVYGSLLGAASWSDHDLTNLFVGSTANKNATGYSGVATLGYVAHLASDAAVDLRTYVAYGTVDGNSFTDSAGITVSGTKDDIVTVGASAGLYAPIAPMTQGFVRGGVKWAKVDSSITVFGVTRSGSADEVSGSVESGIVAHTAEGVEFGASGFGEFSDSTTSYGGRAHVGVKF
jgi:outer membrane autotransporter protein